MSVINRAPVGLLGFLGIKNFGRNPETLVPSVSPTWDLQEQYLNNAARFRFVSAAIAGVGVQVFETVPQNEVWYVTNFAVQINTGAGESITYAIVRVSNAALNDVAITDTVTVGASSVGVRQYDRPIILPPGESLGVRVYAVAGAPVAGTVLRWAPMEA